MDLLIWILIDPGEVPPEVKSFPSPNLSLSSTSVSKMTRYIPLKQSSPVCVKLPPVKWINFTMHESQFLGSDENCGAWSYTWKAILLASGVPHDGSTDPARFLLSEHDDHALAVLLRTTIILAQVNETEITRCVTGKPIFEWVHLKWVFGEDAIKIVYPSELSQEEATKFSVRGKPLGVIEYDVNKHEATEYEAETDTED